MIACDEANWRREPTQHSSCKIKKVEEKFHHKIAFHFSASSIRAPSRISKHERRFDVNHDLKT